MCSVSQQADSAPTPTLLRGKVVERSHVQAVLCHGRGVCALHNVHYGWWKASKDFLHILQQYRRHKISATACWVTVFDICALDNGAMKACGTAAKMFCKFCSSPEMASQNAKSLWVIVMVCVCSEVSITPHTKPAKTLCTFCSNTELA